LTDRKLYLSSLHFLCKHFITAAQYYVTKINFTAFFFLSYLSFIFFYHFQGLGNVIEFQNMNGSAVLVALNKKIINSWDVEFRHFRFFLKNGMCIFLNYTKRIFYYYYYYYIAISISSYILFISYGAVIQISSNA
jgi:hypothetical protein